MFIYLHNGHIPKIELLTQNFIFSSRIKLFPHVTSLHQLRYQYDIQFKMFSSLYSEILEVIYINLLTLCEMLLAFSL